MRWDGGFPSEDCLRLNVWTPALREKKLPVMVWLHGGGFVADSGHELPAYDGENLAEIGGTGFADSANVGMLDIVLALAWVRDNIGNFGGDAGNVTLFGQSGGGRTPTVDGRIVTVPPFSAAGAKQSSSIGGAPGAFHCADLPFCFDSSSAATHRRATPKRLVVWER